jgi:peptide/nickel transport system substrate-binding protein
MHAINRQFLVEAINFNLGKVANGPIPSAAPYFDDAALVKYPYDPAAARALLDDMGLKPKAGGVRAKFSMLMVPGEGPMQRVAQYSKQALAEVGLDVELQTSDNASFGRRNGDWDYDVMWNSYGEYGDPAIGVSRFFLKSNIRKGVPSTNTQGYINPEVDDLFAKAGSAVTHADAQAAYSKLQHILTQDVAMLWMYERFPPLFANKRLRNTVTGPNGPCDGFTEAQPV